MRSPWVRRSRLRDAENVAAVAVYEVAILEKENLVLREELSTVTARVRLEDSLFRYLETKGIELLRPEFQ